jgi:hypothetical protein
MHISDKNWDAVVSDCLHLTELIEQIPGCIVYPNRTEILAVLYDLIHLEDQPKKRRKEGSKKLIKNKIKSTSLIKSE